MKSLTWTRESHGLFDYESKSIKKKDLKASEGGTLVRRGDMVYFTSDSQEPSEEEEQTTMFNLQQSPENKEQFSCHAEMRNNTNDRLWMVIRSLKERGYGIQKHDIIKLGRMKFKVKEFRTANEFYPYEQDALGSEFCEVKEIQPVPEEEKDQMCRFCWMDQDTEENPKVKACKCEGSVKYIHFECLKRWL